MELVYLYIENYRGILMDIDFRFSSNYQFQYSNNILSLGIQDKLGSDFFGSKISNVSVVIGENGSGKTTLMRFFLEELAFGGDTNTLNSKYFAIYKDSSTGDFFSYRKNFEIRTDSSITLTELSEPAFGRLIFYSPIEPISMDNGVFDKEIGSVTNLTNKVLINKYIENHQFPNQNINDVVGYHNIRNIEVFEEYRRWAEFFAYSDIADRADIPIADFLVISLENVSNLRHLHREEIELFEGVRWAIDYYIDFFQAKDEKNITVETILSFFYLSFIVSFLRETPYNLVNNELNEYLVITIMDQFAKIRETQTYDGLKSFFEFVEELVIPPSFIEGNTEGIRGYWNTRAKLILNFTENQLRPIVSENILEYQKLYSLRLSNTWHLVPPKLFINTKKQIREIRELLKDYQGCFLNSEPLRFYWADTNRNTYFFSSGESNFIKLFARLDLAIKTSWSEGNKSLLFLLDEAELTMHPEWQRKCVKLLIEYLEYRLPGTFQCQIILTTHSPIVLSDIPEDNIIMLERDGKRKVVSTRIHELTFGSNIHRLYKRSFIKSGGLIGEFSKMKIESLIDFLKSDQAETNEWNRKKSLDAIHLIGEELIQRRLLDLFTSKFQTKEELMRQRNEIDQKLKDLG